MTRPAPARNHATTDFAPRPPGSGGTTDPIASLGEPFTTYARLLLAFDVADRNLHVALINGAAEERALAEIERDDRRTDVVAFEQHRARTLLMDLRFAERWCPGALQALLAPKLRDDLDAALQAACDLEQRISDAEDVLSDLVTGQEVSL